MGFYMNIRTSIVAGLSAMTLAFAAGDSKTPPGDFYDEVSRLNKVLSEVNRKDVEDVNPPELTDAALNGIRDILDPHTTVFTPKDYEGLKVSMEGKFGGVGITISLRDNVLTVISPLSGTPAFRLLKVSTVMLSTLSAVGRPKILLPGMMSFGPSAVQWSGPSCS